MDEAARHRLSRSAPVGCRIPRRTSPLLDFHADSVNNAYGSWTSATVTGEKGDPNVGLSFHAACLRCAAVKSTKTFAGGKSGIAACLPWKGKRMRSISWTTDRAKNARPHSGQVSAGICSITTSTKLPVRRNTRVTTSSRSWPGQPCPQCVISFFFVFVFSNRVPILSRQECTRLRSRPRSDS